MQNKRNALLVLILTLGVFGILNTEMGVIGMIPLIAETFGVSVPTAGWTVTIFAIGIAICGPVTPMLFSRFNRKHVMLISLGVFIASSVIGMLTTDFFVLLVSRAAPAVFHPVYVSMAFTVAAASVPKNQGPKAVARIFIGVSAGMVLGVPAAGFIASEWSYAAAMGFFAAVNIAVFILTLLFVPSMPAAGAKTYGEQVRILRRRELQRAVAAVIFTNGTTFGFFSFLADYLKTETGLAYSAVSFVLFLYGAANIVGNVLAGKWLAQAPARTIRSTTAGLAAAFMLIGFVGGEAIPMAAVVFFFGVLTGLSSNNFSSVAPPTMRPSSATAFSSLRRIRGLPLARRFAAFSSPSGVLRRRLPVRCCASRFRPPSFCRQRLGWSGRYRSKVPPLATTVLMPTTDWASAAVHSAGPDGRFSVLFVQTSTLPIRDCSMAERRRRKGLQGH